MTDIAAAPRHPRWPALALFALSALAAIVTYNHLGEDAYISFRYAQQFAAGHGLVFNIGERVEGYSNLLWVLLLGAMEWCGVRIDVAARGLSFLWLCGAMAAARRWALDGGERPGTALWLAAFVGFAPLVRYHLDRGLETVPYGASLAIAWLLLASGRCAWSAGAFGAAAVLLRPEGIAFAGVLAGVAWLSAERDARLRRAMRYTACVGGAFVLQLLFRKVYYDAWVPNTMVAKRRGGPGATMEIVRYIASTGGAPAIAAVAYLCALTKREWRALAFGGLALIGGAFAFQLRAGTLVNEAWRYMIAAMLPVAVGLWLALRMLLSASGSRAVRHGAFAAAFGWSLVLWGTKPIPGEPRLFEGNRDAMRSRFHVRLLEFARRPDFAFHWNWYFDREYFVNAEAGRWLREFLPADALIAGDQLGQLGFFAHPKQRFLDMLGLMDRTVAREELQVPYLLERAPDFFCVLTFSEDRFWPRELRGRAVVGSLNPILEDPRVRERYAPMAVLTPRESVTKVTFTVWGRAPQPQPPRIAPIGVDTETFERKWRVLE